MDGVAQDQKGEWVRPAEADLPQLDSTAWVRRGMVVQPDGSTVLPPEFAPALGLKPGDEIIISMLENGTVRPQTLAQAGRQMQGYSRALVPPGTSMVAELIAERRREAERENG